MDKSLVWLCMWKLTKLKMSICSYNVYRAFTLLKSINTNSTTQQFSKTKFLVEMKASCCFDHKMATKIYGWLYNISLKLIRVNELNVKFLYMFNHKLLFVLC